MGLELHPIRIGQVPAAPTEITDLERARRLFDERRARDRAAGEAVELFAEPGWDLLLALFIAYEKERSVEETRVGEAIAIGPRSTRRWVETLIGRGMAARTTRDGVDYVGLTDTGVAFMLRCLQAR